MKFSILTPTFQQPAPLECCIRSVRQQCDSGTDIQIHHVIQNGGPAEDLGHIPDAPESACYQLSVRSEKDTGMYDALNRAYAATDGEILGHLNSDEQYLPDTLKAVADLFQQDPALDVVFGAVIIVDPHGNYLCSRLPLLPRQWHTRVCHLSTFTASMFVRRRAVEQLGTYYDPSFQTAGDADLICRMLAQNLRMRTTKRYLALFADSGDNLALSPRAKEERKRMRESAPWFVQPLGGVLALHHRLRKWSSGAYHPKAMRYPYILPGNQMEYRTMDHPTGRWSGRAAS